MQGLHPAIHQLTDDGLARQLTGTVDVLAKGFQAEIHAFTLLIGPVKIYAQNCLQAPAE